MNKTFYSILPVRDYVRISGKDAESFLQGLITNDIRKTSTEQAIFAALLTPQGKYLYDFFIIQETKSPLPLPGGEGIGSLSRERERAGVEGHTYLLECEKNRADELCKRLAMYRLRSKVTIENAGNKYHAAAMWGDGGEKVTAAEGGAIFRDPRHPALGYRVVAKDAAALQPLGAQKAPFEAYDLHRLTLGVPDGSRDVAMERNFLLECGFDELHGVDFHKGCYVGQEVTARSKHRSGVRKFLHIVQSEVAALPAAGTDVVVDDTVIGDMRSSQGNIGLAMLRVAEVRSAAKSGKALKAGNITVTATLPAWVKTSFAEDASGAS